MISLDYILPQKNGINFTSYFELEKKIKVEFIDSYTDLSLWHTEMDVHLHGSYFVSYPRQNKLMTFLIKDNSNDEILLKITDFSNEFPSDLREIDKLGKLKNFGKSINRNDYGIGITLQEIFYMSAYDHPDCKISAGDVVVDIGGNIGFFAYWSILKGSKHVHIFEPTLELCKKMSIFLENNPVTIYNEAVWSKNASLLLTTSESSFYNSISYTDIPLQKNEAELCKSVVLENWASDNNIKIDFLKIDCEGCEWEILPTMNPEFLSSIPKIVLEYHNNDPDSLIRLFHENGFNTYLSGAMIWAWK